MLKDLYYILQYNGLKNKLVSTPEYGGVHIATYKKPHAYYYQYELLCVGIGHVSEKEDKGYYIKFSYNLKNDLARALQKRDEEINNLKTHYSRFNLLFLKVQ